jgi:hypothetical protein
MFLVVSTDQVMGQFVGHGRKPVGVTIATALLVFVVMKREKEPHVEVQGPISIECYCPTSWVMKYGYTAQIQLVDAA